MSLRHSCATTPMTRSPNSSEATPSHSREKLVDIGEKVERAKKLAPTRPHPSAPHSELFHKTVGPGVGMVDRILDKLTRRHTDS